MPTYEYQCSHCEQVFEEFQKMSAQPLTDCPKCGEQGTLRRLIGGGVGLIFKGSGFYATDYKAGNGNGKTESASAAKPAECASCPAAAAPDAPCKQAQ